MVARALFTSKTDEWSSPETYYREVVREFGPFDLDPAATPENAKAPKFYTRADDGLMQPWFGKVWCNPPYGRGIGDWVAKAVCEAEMVGLVELVVMLLPARTDTKWWHKYVIPCAAEIRFVAGRLKFGGSKNSAPFPSALVVFRSSKGT